jgi:hypothetical protein
VEETLAMTEKKTLFHYTAPVTSHLGAILADGVIKTTEPNISFERRHAGPDVVWLTDSDDTTMQDWATDISPLKQLAVLGVELDPERVFHWPAWSRGHGIEDVTYEGLAASGGDPERWWVAPQPIQKWDIKRLVIAPMDTGAERIGLREFAGGELQRLFHSAGARNALHLPKTKTKAL